MSNVWMPLYVADYLADTTHLSAAEHGAYLLLIMAYWQSGAALPDEDAKLARIARMTPKEWRAARPTVAEFFTVGDGVWRHGRIDGELAKAERITDQKRAAGRASAERRGQREGNGRSTGVDEPLERQGQRRGNQSPSPTQPPDNPTTERVSTDGASRAHTKAGHGIAWPVPEEPPAWAGYEAELRGLPADAVAETYTRWRDHRMARGMTPVDPVADWRAWCSGEVRRQRDGTGPPGPTGKGVATVAEVMDLVRKRQADDAA